MKRVHSALKLRHHKHTGKLLAHKHTSYRVLFLLLLTPIAMLALVGQLAGASDYQVKATVPAIPPSGVPVIQSPRNGSTVESASVTVSGTCPVATPAVVITIKDGTTLLGSGTCQPDGSFSVLISLSYGKHTLVAGVVTITGEEGGASSPVTVTRIQKNNQIPAGAPNTAGGSTLTAPPTIILITSSSPFLTLDPNRSVIWKGTFSGGAPPYQVVVKWGDGSTDTYTVRDESEQSHSHTYQENKSYQVTITATDSTGNTATTSSAVVTMRITPLVVVDIGQPSPNAFVAFVQHYLPQIYIVTFSSVVFLWYLEHGRHLLRWHRPTKKSRHAH